MWLPIRQHPAILGDWMIVGDPARVPLELDEGQADGRDEATMDSEIKDSEINSIRKHEPYGRLNLGTADFVAKFNLRANELGHLRFTVFI